MNLNKKIFGIGILIVLMLEAFLSMAESVYEPKPDQPSVLLEFWFGKVQGVVKSDNEFCFKCVDVLYIQWQSMGFGSYVIHRVNNTWSMCYDKQNTFWLGMLTNNFVCLVVASRSEFPNYIY